MSTSASSVLPGPTSSMQYIMKMEEKLLKDDPKTAAKPKTGRRRRQTRSRSPARRRRRSRQHQVRVKTQTAAKAYAELQLDNSSSTTQNRQASRRSDSVDGSRTMRRLADLRLAFDFVHQHDVVDAAGHFFAVRARPSGVSRRRSRCGRLSWRSPRGKPYRSACRMSSCMSRAGAPRSGVTPQYRHICRSVASLELMPNVGT